MPTEKDKTRVVSEASTEAPTQAQLLRRSLAVGAKMTRLAMENPELSAEVRAVLASTMQLLADWEQYAHGLAEEVGGRDREVEALRDTVATQAHRIKIAEETLGDMEKLAHKDPLTGAWNRLALEKVSPGLFDRMKQSGKPLSMIYMDLDRFKEVNDIHGHAAGDHALKLFVRIIGDRSRLSDFLFRLGGDEFCLLLPETDIEGATTLAERIREYLEKTPIQYEGYSLPVTTSLGVAQADFEHDDGVDALKEHADRAQMVAKSYKNIVAVHHPANGTPEAVTIHAPKGIPMSKEPGASTRVSEEAIA